jgi:hypothetical protein
VPSLSGGHATVRTGPSQLNSIGCMGDFDTAGEFTKPALSMARPKLEPGNSSSLFQPHTTENRAAWQQKTSWRTNTLWGFPHTLGMLVRASEQNSQRSKRGTLSLWSGSSSRTALPFGKLLL